MSKSKQHWFWKVIILNVDQFKGIKSWKMMTWDYKKYTHSKNNHGFVSWERKIKVMSNTLLSLYDKILREFQRKE